GRSMVAAALVRNLGQLAAPAFRLTFFMSPTDATPGAGVVVGVRDFAGLGAGVNASVSTSFTVPIDFEPGSYYVSGVVDVAGTVLELREDNNGLTAPGQVAVSLLRPDLTILALAPPVTAQTGRPLVASALVRNAGSSAAAAFRLTFFMSASDPTPGAGV